MMKDFLGKEISIADEVIYMHQHYMELCKGVVVDFTPKKVRIKQLPVKKWQNETTLRDSKTIVVVGHNSPEVE